MLEFAPLTTAEYTGVDPYTLTASGSMWGIGIFLHRETVCQGHSHPSAPSVKVSTLTSSLSGLPVMAPVGCPISTKDELKARIPERVMAMSASNLV